MSDGETEVSGSQAGIQSLAAELFQIASRHLKYARFEERQKDDSLDYKYIQESLREGPIREKMRKRFLLYAYIKDEGRRRQIIDGIQAALRPDSQSVRPNSPPENKKTATQNKTLKQLVKDTHRQIVTEPNFRKLSSEKQQEFLRKTIACISHLFEEAIEELDENEPSQDLKIDAYRANAVWFSDRLNQQRYNGFERFIRFNPWITKVVDNKSQHFELNLAPYEFFDRGKQYIGLVKVAERLFGVQAAYLIELIFHSIQPNNIPGWVSFMKNSFFHHLNFGLQFVDSVFFSTGALITYRDKGFRKWSKIFFASGFLALAAIPWAFALFAIHVSSVFFKIGAVALGLIKSCLDMRHYYLKRSQNKINVANLKSKLISLKLLRSAVEANLITKPSKGGSKELAKLILKEFNLNKSLAEQKSQRIGNFNRIVDKRFAMGVSVIALIGMSIALFIPHGFFLIPSIIMLAIFTISAAVKFFYRMYTFQRPDPIFDIHLDLQNEKKVILIPDQGNWLEKLLGLKHRPVSSKMSFVLQLELFRNKKKLDALDKQIKAIQDKPAKSRGFFEGFKLDRLIKDRRALHKKISSDLPTFNKQASLFDDPIWQDPQHQLNLIRSACKFDSDFKKTAVYKTLEKISYLEEDLIFYKRQVNKLPESRRAGSSAEKQVKKMKDRIAAKWQDLRENKELLAESFELIREKAEWFTSIDMPHCYMRFLMEIYHALPDEVKVPIEHSHDVALEAPFDQIETKLFEMIARSAKLGRDHLDIPPSPSESPIQRMEPSEREQSVITPSPTPSLEATGQFGIAVTSSGTAYVSYSAPQPNKDTSPAPVTVTRPIPSAAISQSFFMSTPQNAANQRPSCSEESGFGLPRELTQSEGLKLTA